MERWRGRDAADADRPGGIVILLVLIMLVLIIIGMPVAFALGVGALGALLA